MLGPYTGDYTGGFWNSQAYFASDPELQHAKQSYADRLFAQRDFVGLAETHSAHWKALASRALAGGCSFWAHGSNSQAGIGLLLKP
eukprot:3371661-Pyramimonas_sp.AAC.1